MWESSVYNFEEETMDGNGKVVKRPFYVNVTYSAPRNLDDPKKALIGIFNKITENMDPSKTKILDVGAAKLRNTLWLLEKGFSVWAVEFPELRERLPDARKKWELASKYPNFHNITFPKDFINLRGEFDIILLINVVNVMPIPIERFALLNICRDKIKNNGMLLWHQWRGYSISSDKYTEENQFIDGYLMGSGPNHSFYVEESRESSHEILYSAGFAYDPAIKLHNIPSNTSAYSYIFRPKHKSLTAPSLNIEKLIKTKTYCTENPQKNILSILHVYNNELRKIPSGKEYAHRYHLIASRIFYEIFRTQLAEPIIECEINERRGRIDVVYKNKNKYGIFKNLKELRDIPCPNIMVECKNYENDLTNSEYDQLSGRLSPHRGMIGFLLCRDKKNEVHVIKHCKDRYKGGSNRYIIVLDDKDLAQLSKHRIDEANDDCINDFVDKKIDEIVD